MRAYLPGSFKHVTMIADGSFVLAGSQQDWSTADGEPFTGIGCSACRNIDVAFSLSMCRLARGPLVLSTCTKLSNMTKFIGTALTPGNVNLGAGMLGCINESSLLLQARSCFLDALGDIMNVQVQSLQWAAGRFLSAISIRRLAFTTK